MREVYPVVMEGKEEMHKRRNSLSATNKLPTFFAVSHVHVIQAMRFFGRIAFLFLKKDNMSAFCLPFYMILPHLLNLLIFIE